MNGLIVFNSANDVVFQHFNAALANKIREIGKTQGLLPEHTAACNSNIIDGNIILQIFSPIINSQRMMHCQFDNTYNSFQCENGLNFAFGELLGYTFIKIAQKSLDTVKRHLGVVIALTRNLYGANLFAAQAGCMQEQLLALCLEHYEEQMWQQEQALLLEALPYLIINEELKRVVHSALDAGLERLRELGHLRAHCLLCVKHKFVSVASSKQALPLSPTDLLFIYVLSRSLQNDTVKPLNRCVAVFLQGNSQDPNSGCVPCIVHLAQLEKGMFFVQIIEYANLQVASSMYDTFFVLQKVGSLQLQGDCDALRPSFDSLESFVKQSLDALKRAKLRSEVIDMAMKRFSAKWENLRRMYNEFFKSYERELLVRIESNLPAFVDELKQLFTLTCCDSSVVNLEQLPIVADVVEGKLLEVAEFLSVKVERNVSITAYLDEFPGLIHFMFVNRTTGLMVAPDLHSSKLLPKQYLWNMVEFSRNYLKRGQSMIMWKDKIFNYAYFLWFEDQSSAALKPFNLQQQLNANGNVLKSLYEPGLFAADYYQQLAESYFPKSPPNKIKCYELFLIHLGLVTATCAVEHARRLVATIADVAGENNL